MSPCRRVISIAVVWARCTPSGWPGPGRAWRRPASTSCSSSLGADLPYFTGYEAMPLERLTMLVVPRDGDATLVVPRLEAPRVVERPEAFRLVAVGGDRRPGGHRGRPGRDAREWRPSATAPGPRFLVDLQALLPATTWRQASARHRRRCGRSRTRPRSPPCAGRPRPPTGWRCSSRRATSPLVGRTEAEVSADLGRRLVDEGHARVNFAIVGSGPNAASPHHEPGGG